MNKKSPSELRTEFYAYFKSLTPEVIAEFQGNFPISNPEGHMLSGKNISFLKFQGGEKIKFTVVARYRQWKKFDRQVRKGQHGFWIFIPAMIKTSIEENGSKKTVEEFDRFLMAKVFDISQTGDIKEMPEFVDEDQLQTVQERPSRFEISGDYEDLEDDSCEGHCVPGDCAACDERYQDPDLGGTGHGDISWSDADPGL